jgi:hypothetical protein
MREQAGMESGDLFRSFLPWAPELMPFLDIEDVKGRPHRPLALELIAKWLKTTPWIIKHAISDAELIPPDEMRAFLLIGTGANGQRQAVAKPKKDRKHGPDKQAVPTRSYYKIGNEVENKIPADLKDDLHAIVHTRKLVAADRQMSPKTVANYHKKFRQFLNTEGKLKRAS